MGSHILEGFSVSGSFTFATGTPLTPSYRAARAQSVACGTAGTLRPNLVPGASLTAGGGSLQQWFNHRGLFSAAPTPGSCDVFGNAPRNSIAGPGTVQNNMSLSKTMQLGETRSMEIRATINNVFNTVQYCGRGHQRRRRRQFGQVTSVGPMRSFQFMAQVQVLR